uniref:Ig-like domain-containing protein n=1 Tax=Electrophorus electricus TaxID=8005 RepID=A0AAY5F115_ELEEL
SYLLPFLSPLQVIQKPYCSSSDVKNVYQTPPDLIKNKLDSTDLYCSHAIQDFDFILWYKQSTNNQLYLLGYLNMNLKNPEEALKNKIELDGNGQNNSTLTIKNLEPNDSAVYFCAAKMHSATVLCFLLQKPSSFTA